MVHDFYLSPEKWIEALLPKDILGLPERRHRKPAGKPNSTQWTGTV